MSDLDMIQLGRRAEGMIRELAAITSLPGTITRLYLTPEHRAAANLVAGWMRRAGLDAGEDGRGTVTGRLRATQEVQGNTRPRRLLIGSHIDTVIDAGAYDGTLGVVAAILAVEHLVEAHGTMPFGIDILAFGDEEGSRFPATLVCSGSVASGFDRGVLDSRDDDGVTLAEALQAFGGSAEARPGPAYEPGEAAAYVEVHIEQGPVLEAAGEPLGVVTAISAQTRAIVTVTGTVGHAGTVPMALRHDALAAAAEMIGAVEAVARTKAASFTVATVGKLVIASPASNVIAGRVEFTVDLRSQTSGQRDVALRQLRLAFETIATRRRVGVSLESVHEAAATPCDPGLQQRLADAIAAGSPGRVPRLASGAGHDGQAMAALCPIAMLFVRCRGGISHNPAEFASVEDMGRAVLALIRFIEAFDAEDDQAIVP